MADEESLYLDNLDEFINDQDKVVTYKWLSRTLSVASNTAKQMLYAFLLKEREKKNNSLTATYLVGGRCKVDDHLVHQYILTSDDKLEETKDQFECVTSVHVYSLQKKTPKDINTLYTVDYEIHQEHRDEPNKWTHIYCKEAVKLSDGGASRGSSKGKPGKENAVPKPEMTNGLGSSSSMTDKSKPKPSNQRTKKGQLPSMGMFAVKNEKKLEQQKPDEPANNADPNKKEKPAKPVEKSKPSAMMSFFGKQISGGAKEPAKSKPVPKVDPEEKVEEKSEEKKTDESKVIKETPESKQKPNKSNKQTRKRIKNLASSDEEEDPIPKTLKKLASDSESEEEIKPRRSKSKNKKEKEKEVESKKPTKKETAKKGKEASCIQDEAKNKKPKMNRKRKKEEKEESSEEADSINSKSDSTVVSETPTPSQRPAETSTKRRKRRKVMKSKTYVDDDGFMVTEKVYESESTDASDEEEIIETKQEPSLSNKGISPDSKAKKQMDLKPVKQASLMSFFKKN